MTPSETDQYACGYIKLHRKVMRNPVWRQLQPSVFKVLCYFLMRANWRDETWYDGRREVPVPRGSFITSYRQTSLETLLTLKKTRLAFEHLKNLNFAAYSRAGLWTMVTISNYETYQSLEDRLTAGLTAGSRQGQGTVRAQLGATNKEIEEVEEREEGEEARARTPAAHRNGTAPLRPCGRSIPDWVDRWYGRHPKKRDRTLVEYAVVALAQKCPERFDEIDAIHERRCTSTEWRKQQARYAPKLANWLEDEGYDEPDEDGGNAEHEEFDQALIRAMNREQG